jgi:gluconolactonase
MNMSNPLDGFTVERSSISTIGHDLQRPECILAERNGTLWAADARGGVMRILANGEQTFIGQKADDRFANVILKNSTDFEAKFTQGTLPNGLAFAENGDILIANFGTDCLEQMSRDGRTATLYDRLYGQPIGKVNFVLRDSKNRIWITVSTRINPWTKAAASRVRDGYIAVIDESGLRVVADGFYFTNEIRLDAEEEWLYIVETTGPYISRMRLADSPNGVMLTDREIFGPDNLGGSPDGIAFDSYGNLWCTLVMVDRLVAITPQGEMRLLLDDGDPAASRNLVEKMRAGTASAADMAQAHGTLAPWMASITFGGPDLCTVYLGSLLGNTIPYFRSPVSGLPMVHWNQASNS